MKNRNDVLYRDRRDEIEGLIVTLKEQLEDHEINFGYCDEASKKDAISDLEYLGSKLRKIVEENLA